MRRSMLSIGAFVAGLGLSGSSCIEPGVFACVVDSDCDDGGRCGATNYCSYPDPDCPSGWRFSEYAEFGPVCADDSEGMEGTTGGPMGPVPGERCGNDVVDDTEICDDGNRLNDDGCNSYCIAPGGTVWETTYDSIDHDEDRGFAIALSPAGDTVAVTGVSAVPGEDWNILVQLYDVGTGALLWSETHGGDALGEDRGEEITFDADGNIIVVGYEVTAAAGGNIWLAKYDPLGTQLWFRSFDEEGGDDKAQSVALGGGQIIVAGHVEHDVGTAGQADIWLGRFDLEGVLVGTPIVVAGAASGRDEAVDVRSDVAGQIYATGWLHDTPDEPSVWTAVYDANDSLVWSDVYSDPDPSSADRGVGLGFDPDGNVVVAGTAGADIWVRRYQADGTPADTIVVDGPRGRHDEASDVVFASDGSFVVSGFTDFATEGFATGDIWVRRYDATGAELWTVTHDGDAKEIDKALALIGLDDGSVITVGYVTTPGQVRDVWLRKIAS